jgi:hypothetical protein
MADAPPPVQPTSASPGTPEKIAALAERAERGVSLWHPADGADATLQLSRNDRLDQDDPATRAVIADALRNGLDAAEVSRRLGCSRFAAHRLLSRLRADQPE